MLNWLIFGLIFTNTSFANAKLEPKYLKMLETMVNINTGTGNVHGADQVRAIIRKELFSLGFKETVRGDPKGSRVYAYDIDSKTQKKIMFYAHVDTVFSKEHPFQKIKHDGDKLYGPGVIDMKGGIVMILNLVE